MSSIIRETATAALKGFAVAGGATAGVFFALEIWNNAKERKKTPQFYGLSLYTKTTTYARSVNDRIQKGS